jgi:hypothetical protein
MNVETIQAALRDGIEYSECWCRRVQNDGVRASIVEDIEQSILFQQNVLASLGGASKQGDLETLAAHARNVAIQMLDRDANLARRLDHISDEITEMEAKEIQR